MSTPTAETPLQREQRMFRELSSRLINTIISRIFDLRPEKAARRRGYFFILFLLSGFLLSLIYYKLPLWLGYMGNIFNSILALNTNISVEVAVADFFNFLKQVILDPRILQYLPVFIAPYFIALQSAAIYLADIFELEDVSVARNFVSGVALTGGDDTIRVKNGDVTEENQETPIFLIGGPGKVLVELDSVALFERADGTPHIIGPTGGLPGGTAILEGFERFRQALDIRNHHVDLRDKDEWKAVFGRSLDGIPVKATDVRLMFSIFRGENRETSAENPYPFSKQAVEQIVYKATSKVTPGQNTPSKFEFQWIPKMVTLIRGKLSGFMSEHNLTEYMASIGTPEFEKVIQREDQIFEQMRDLVQSGEEMSERKEIKPPPEFQPRSKIKSLFAQFADGFSSQARTNGVELQWIGVGTWESPIEIIPEKHLEAWKQTQKNIKDESKRAMDKIEQEEVIEKTKELIQKVPLDAYDNIRNSYKTSKKSGRQIPKKKESHKLEQLKREKGDDFVFDREEMDRFAEMLHIIQDMQEENEDFEEVEPQNIDHAHDVQALLLEYRRLFQETVDFIKAKKQEVPQSILDAIKHIDNQIGHWAGRQS